MPNFWAYKPIFIKNLAGGKKMNKLKKDFFDFIGNDFWGQVLYMLFCGLLFLVLLMIIDSTSCSLNVNQTENKPQQINKQNVNIEIRDTLQIDNRNFSIMLIDSIEYLVYKNGSKLEIIKHR
jgi:hypothetical protein